jgi:hypothetical protein
MVVFISYQREDTLFAAHALYYALRLAGHEAFVDTGSMGRGDDYRPGISNAVSNAVMNDRLPALGSLRCLLQCGTGLLSAGSGFDSPGSPAFLRKTGHGAAGYRLLTDH